MILYILIIYLLNIEERFCLCHSWVLQGLVTKFMFERQGKGGGWNIDFSYLPFQNILQLISIFILGCSIICCIFQSIRS